MKTLLTALILTTLYAVNGIVYKALKGDSLEVVEQALSSLDHEESNSTKNAYKGALLMKKAGLISGLAKKLDVFKDGHELLETEITTYPNNIEYRFLRLTIQEHAPKILGYNDEIEEDKNLIITNYKKLSSELKEHIHDYTSQSNALTPADLIE